MRLLPLGFPALHFLFEDGKRLADGTIEAFALGVTGDGREAPHFVWRNSIVVFNDLEQE
jgi:hypothetical protein